jgi:hypothetical protein
VIPPGGGFGFARFALSVLSEDLKQGCGTAGDTITFTIDGRPASQTVAWEARDPDERPISFGSNLTLTTGSPFAYFSVRLDEGGEPGFGLSQRLVVAMIDGTGCAAVPGGGFGNALVGVPSEEQAPGCGRPGKAVTFAVDGFAVPEIVLWQAGERPHVAFTFEPSRVATLAGPAFAYFEIAPESDQEILRVNAYVGDVFCGGTVGSVGDPLLLAVAPDELIEGCGREGALVTLEVNGAEFGGPVAWKPGFHNGPEVPGTSSDANGITPPSAGDAGLKR